MTTLNATTNPKISPTVRTLDIAYTPDSDDAFNFYGWEHGPVRCPGYKARFHCGHIAQLNEAARHGEYDVVAVSSVAYPALADQYRVLSVGSSVGRGYGPVLVAREAVDISTLGGKRVALAGLNTTGGVLARMYCPSGTKFVEMAYDKIAASLLRGEIDAGVMIHEELVHYPKLGLQRVRDLGAAWTEETGLPLPVGLNLVRRSLGLETAVQIARACRDSLNWSLANRERAMAHVGRMGRSCAETFVPMFSNGDTLCMPADVRTALRLLLDRLAGLGWAGPVANLEIIDA